MNLLVHNTTTLYGQATPPGSKSHSIRGILLALLASGESTLHNYLNASDIQDALNVCKSLHTDVLIQGNKLTLKNNGLPLKTKDKLIYSGNSGITTRFIMPMLGLRENPDQAIILDCGDQMRERPIDSLIHALRNLGLTIHYLKKEGAFPIEMSGKLIGGEAEVDGITSQYLSALLMTLPCAPNDSRITVENLHERPYVEMTLRWLKQENICFFHEHHKNTDIYFIEGNQSYKPMNTMIPGDFSSASYLIAAGAVTQGQIELSGLDYHDEQGDKKLLSILSQMGADITMEEDRLLIRGGEKLHGIKIDANDIPDLLPTLAVIGTQAEGKTEILNVKQARIKETDRIHSMTDGLRRLGAHIDEHVDGLTVYQSKLHGAHVQGYDDHRTVMALSIAGLLAEGRTSITDSEAINKTFPTFIDMMQSLGAKMEVDHATH